MGQFEAKFPNGAAVMADRDVRGRVRWAVFNAAGGLPVRLMRDRAEAIAFAKGLPALDLPPVIPPSPINLSPRAHAARKERGIDAPVPTLVPMYESSDGVPSRPMSAARARSGLGPSGRVVGVAPRPREPT